MFKKLIQGLVRKEQRHDDEKAVVYVSLRNKRNHYEYAITTNVSDLLDVFLEPREDTQDA